MRKVLTLISCICLLFLFNIDNSSAQVLNRFRGTLNVFASSGTSPTYTITGFFNDQLGRYSSDSLSLNDYLYISFEDGCARFRVDSILNKSGGIIQARVIDVAGVTSVFPGGIGAILAETPNNNYPGVISGISEDLNACIRQHFTELVDLSGSGVTVQDGVTLNLDEPVDNTITGEVIVSDSITNIIEILPSGLFADVFETDIQLTKDYFGVSSNLGFALEAIEAQMHRHRDGQTIDFITTTGSPKPDTISAEVILSPDSGNTLETRANGLYATGGSSFRIYEFVIGDAVIRASDTTGVTFVKSGGTGTLTLPDSVYLISLAISGVTADLNSANFKVVIDNGSSIVNQGVATMLPPNIDVINTAAQLGGGPNDSAPFIYDEMSSPQVQITGVGSGSVTARVINLDAFSNWVIKLNY